MATPISDFLKNYMGIVQLMEQARAGKASRATGAANVAGEIPGQEVRVGMAPHLASLYNVDPDAIGAIIGSMAPAQGAVARRVGEEGMDALTPEQRRFAAVGQATGADPAQIAQSGLLESLVPSAEGFSDPFRSALGQGLAARLVGMQGPGEAMVSAAGAALPPEVLQYGAEVGMGTAVGAPQRAGVELGWANWRQGERALDQQYQMHLDRLDFEGDKLLIAENRAMEVNPLPYLQTYQSLFNNLTSNRASMSGVHINHNLHALNQIAEILNAAGYTRLPILTEENFDRFHPTVPEALRQALTSRWRR